MSLLDYGVRSVRKSVFLDLRDTLDIQVGSSQFIYDLGREYVSFTHEQVPMQESLVLSRDLQRKWHCQLVRICSRGIT